MNAGLMRWPDAVAPAGRILLVVNSHATQSEEIARVLNALQAHGGLQKVSAIAPASVCAELVGRGIAAGSVLPFEVEVGYFLQGDRALQWAIRQHADLVVGSEPYVPNNEEVKDQFELRVAPMIGPGRLVAQSLPDERVVLLTVEDLWKRAARQEAVSAHRTRVSNTLEHLHQVWSAGATPASKPEAQAIAARLLAAPDPGDAPEPASVLDACRWTCDRLHAALQSDGGYPPAPIRVVVDPAGASPRAGWLGGRLDPVRRPSQVAPAVRWHGVKLAFRGHVDGPYSYLLMSRPMVLRPGDAAIAEGRVHRGGVTLGLVKDGRWASRADVIDRGAFVAAAVATEPGEHALVVANCLHGADRRAAIAIRRFGFRRSE